MNKTIIYASCCMLSLIALTLPIKIGLPLNFQLPFFFIGVFIYAFYTFAMFKVNDEFTDDVRKYLYTLAPCPILIKYGLIMMF